MKTYFKMKNIHFPHKKGKLDNLCHSKPCCSTISELSLLAFFTTEFCGQEVPNSITFCPTAVCLLQQLINSITYNRGVHWSLCWGGEGEQVRRELNGFRRTVK